MPEKNDRITKYVKEVLDPDVNSASQLIVFSEKSSTRLIYTLDFIFKKTLRINYSFTDDESEFRTSSLGKINYSLEAFENVFQIIPSGFLSEISVRTFEPDNFKKDDLLYFFAVKGGDLNYDVFSSVFYFISRYEEWQPFKADNHGRFELRNSLLFKLGFSKIPVVDNWILELKNLIKAKYSSINFPQRKFKYISTIDVDNVYAYKAKPWYRVGGALVKDILKFDFKNFSERIRTVCFKKTDPFDCYDQLIETSKKFDIPLFYFFLYRNGTEYDRTIDPDHPEFISLLKKLSSNNIPIGIHPSYKSSEVVSLLKNEIDLLRENSNENIICSRNHYLRNKIQTTPQQLIDNGILYDFTMGFASGIGFRAGTSLPFDHFDLKNNVSLPLIAVPFAVMDGAFFVYDNVNVSAAEKEIMGIMNAVKKVQGSFVTVFHEHTFSESLHPGWKELYLRIHVVNND